MTAALIMEHNEKTSKKLLSLEDLENLLKAYNNHLKQSGKQLTGPELDRQKAAFMDRVRGILN